MTTTVTRSEAVATIEELAAMEPTNRYSQQMLQSARDHLGRHDARPSWWTAEHYSIALRDAKNAAHLGIKHFGE